MTYSGFTTKLSGFESTVNFYINLIACRANQKRQLQDHLYDAFL
jgi:hypothetical protein